MSLITIASTVTFIPNTPPPHDKHPSDLGQNLRFRLQRDKHPPPVLGTKFCRLYHQITKTRKNENFSPNALTPPPCFAKLKIVRGGGAWYENDGNCNKILTLRIRSLHTYITVFYCACFRNPQRRVI